MPQLWAIARFDLRLNEAEFYRLTPRQFNLLAKRLIEERAHREVIAAYTTAAVINYSMLRPEEPVSAMAFVPSRLKRARTADEDLSDEELERQSEFNLNALILAAKLRAQAAARAESNG